MVHVAGGGGSAARGEPADLITGLNESPQAGRNPVAGDRVHMGACTVRAVTRITGAAAARIRRSASGSRALPGPLGAAVRSPAQPARSRRNQPRMKQPRGEATHGRDQDDDLARGPGAMAPRTTDQHGGRMRSRSGADPCPDRDDTPLAGLVGHGGLGQIPRHGGDDRADPAQRRGSADRPASVRHGTLSFGLPLSNSLIAWSSRAPGPSPGSSPSEGIAGQQHPGPGPPAGISPEPEVSAEPSGRSPRSAEPGS